MGYTTVKGQEEQGDEKARVQRSAVVAATKNLQTSAPVSKPARHALDPIMAGYLSKADKDKYTQRVNSTVFNPETRRELLANYDTLSRFAQEKYWSNHAKITGDEYQKARDSKNTQLANIYLGIYQENRKNYESAGVNLSSLDKLFLGVTAFTQNSPANPMTGAILAERALGRIETEVKRANQANTEIAEGQISKREEENYRGEEAREEEKKRRKAA